MAGPETTLPLKLSSTSLRLYLGISILPEKELRGASLLEGTSIISL